jgi:competence protein ComEC
VVSGACLGIAVGVTMRRTRPFVITAAVAAVALIAVVPRLQGDAVAAPSALRVTFLDVGQGDATLIQRRQAAILVDTGPPDGPVLARLRHAGVRRLDLLVITHAQADHDGAAAAILDALPVALVLDGRDGVRDQLGARMASVAGKRHVRLLSGRAGEVLRVGAIELRVLWPQPASPEAKAGADPNERAIVAEAQADGVTVLLTADAESDVLDRLDLGPVDVLKVSHHGSADPGLQALLERLRPRVAAIEVGRHNRYGHPVPATVAALRVSGAAVFRTDRDGSIRVEPAAGALRVRTHV